MVAGSPWRWETSSRWVLAGGSSSTFSSALAALIFMFSAGAITTTLRAGQKPAVRVGEFHQLADLLDFEGLLLRLKPLEVAD